MPPHCPLVKAVPPKEPTCVLPFLLLRGLCLWCLWSVSPSFHGVHSRTAHTVPSLRPLIPNSSLIRCEPVRVYHHHPRPRVPLDPIYNTINLGGYLVWALPWGLDLKRFPFRGGWTIEPHSITLVVTCTVGQSIVMSFHWVTGQLQVLAGIIVHVVYMVH
jgi:hypothetical protein